MKEEKRIRNTMLRYRVTPEERDKIEWKMEEYGTDNMAAYLRKMDIERLELPEIGTITGELRKDGRPVLTSFRALIQISFEHEKSYLTFRNQVALCSLHTAESVILLKRRARLQKPIIDMVFQRSADYSNSRLPASS